MKIFIGCRRDDSAGYAGRLFEYLAAPFGGRNVFIDIETIEPTGLGEQPARPAPVRNYGNWQFTGLPADGRVLMAAYHDGTLKLWQVP